MIDWQNCADPPWTPVGPLQKVNVETYQKLFQESPLDRELFTIYLECPVVRLMKER